MAFVSSMNNKAAYLRNCIVEFRVYNMFSVNLHAYKYVALFAHYACYNVCVCPVVQLSIPLIEIY